MDRCIEWKKDSEPKRWAPDDFPGPSKSRQDYFLKFQFVFLGVAAPIMRW